MLFFIIPFLILSTVDRNNFRGCKDMRFCRENQHVTYKWAVDLSSVQKSNSKITMNLLLNDSPANLQLLIYTLATGGIRFRVTPLKKETFNRYDLSQNENVINQKVINDILPIEYSIDGSQIHINAENYQGIQLQIDSNPLKISIKRNENILTIINGRGQFIFEHHNTTTIPPEVFNGFTDHIKNGPTAVGADILFTDDVKLSGLSERASPLNLADTFDKDSEDESNDYSNEPLRLFNSDAFEYEADTPIHLYSSIPFCHAHSDKISAAIFWMNPSDTFVSLQTFENENSKEREIKFVSEGGYLDFVLFYGNNDSNQLENVGFKDIMKQYSELTGYPMFAPLFSLGYHQSRWGYATQHEVGVVIRGLDEVNIPFDSLWLDVDHLANKYPFTFSRQGFPNPSALINELANDDRYVVRLCDPHFPRDNNYKQFRESRRLGYLISNDDGTPYFGDSWPGSCVFPDFLNPAALQWYSQQYSYENEKEYSGQNVFYWNDMNEPSIFKEDQSTFPKSLVHYGDVEDREVHNLYGLLNTVGTYQGLLNRNPDKKQRPFILTRSYFAGSQKFAWTWTGDNTASWEHLAISLPMTVISGLCGMPFTGSDLGGFLKSPDGNLITRWFQLGAYLYPFFREHCHHKSWRREPFIFDGDEQDNLKDAIILRYKLLPLWYTAVRNTNQTGIPPSLPLWAVFHRYNEEIDIHDIDSCAILYESIYVVPVLEDDVDEIEVTKPPGTWYRLFTGKKLNEQTETIPVTIKDTPAFLRGGKIIPTFSQVEKSSHFTFANSPLTLFVALDEQNNANGDIYLDDGESYNYMEGEFIHRRFECQNGRLQSIKFDDGQRAIPELVKNMIIDKIIVYGATKPIEPKNGNASFDNDVLTIENLHFKITDDWSIDIQ